MKAKSYIFTCTGDMITLNRATVLLLFMVAICFSYSLFAQNTDSGRGEAPTKSLTYNDTLVINQLFFQALKEKVADNLPKAAETFKKVIQIDPNNDASIYELANIKRKLNNYPEAQSLLEKDVVINPENEWYWLALATCYENSNDFVKLQRVFGELIRINPDKPEYYLNKANAYFFDGKYKEALEVYAQLEQLTGPTEELLTSRQKVYLRQGNIDLAAKQLEDLIADNPQIVKYYLFLSELYSTNNLIEKAITTLQNGIKLNPNSGLLHLELAEIYRNKQDQNNSFNELLLAFADPEIELDQKVRMVVGYLPRFPDPVAKSSALQLSKLLVEVHPNEAKAYEVYGNMLLQNGKVADARAMYRKSYSLNNQVYEVQEQLVRIELSENNLDATIIDGENSLSYFPNQAWMNYLVGVAWLQKNNFSKALQYLQNATALNIDDKELLTQSYSALGDCYNNLKDNKNSDQAYEKALSYNPDNVYTLNNYAYYLSQRGVQLEKAARLSKHAIDLQPDVASFQDTYAWILFKRKDYTGAKLWIEKALATDKNNSNVIVEHYGDIVFYLGDIDKAVENWKRAKVIGNKSLVLEKKINERKYIE
jgi:tetratricopeptide (TPR) repeat protein